MFFHYLIMRCKVGRVFYLACCLGLGEGGKYTFNVGYPVCITRSQHHHNIVTSVYGWCVTAHAGSWCGRHQHAACNTQYTQGYIACCTLHDGGRTHYLRVCLTNPCTHSCIAKPSGDLIAIGGNTKINHLIWRGHARSVTDFCMLWCVVTSHG